MARSKSNPDAWTPNQIVAYRVAEARRLRQWTQDQAAAELEPYLGARLSAASFSAIERSFHGGRVRQFTADELVALARGFRLPLGWFFTPPPMDQGVTVRTPDASREGLDPILLIDLALGEPDTLLEWTYALVAFSKDSVMRRLTGIGTTSTDDPVMPERLNELVRLRARTRITELFGDIEAAKTVLGSLADVLDQVEEEEVEAAAEEREREDLRRSMAVGAWRR